MQLTLQALVLIYKVQMKQKLLLFPANLALRTFITFWRLPVLHFKNHNLEPLAVGSLAMLPL